jgi:hypothetical protein
VCVYIGAMETLIKVVGALACGIYTFRRSRHEQKSGRLQLSDSQVFILVYTRRGWLRHYATSRKVAGSIPDEVIRFFN